MVAFKALAASLLIGLVAADECPALSNTFGYKPTNLWTYTTVDCRVSIQAAECATNVRPSAGQTWAAFRINHNHDCNHGAPYGDCCVFAGKPPDSYEKNPSVWMFYWDDVKSGQNPGFGTNCIQDPTTGCCGRQDEGHVLVSGGCPYPPSKVRDLDGNLVTEMFGRVGDGCTKAPDDGQPNDPPNTQPGTQPSKQPPKGKKKPPKNKVVQPVEPNPTPDVRTSTIPVGTAKGGLDGTSDYEAETTNEKEGSAVHRLGRRLASFRLARREESAESPASSKKKNSGYRRAISGAGPGGFPKCGDYGNFGPEITCKKDPDVKCKPKVKNPGKGKYNYKDPGDIDGTTCPKGKSSLEEASAAGTGTTAAGEVNSRRHRRWAAMDASSDLLKRFPDSGVTNGGNQFDKNNAGQLKAGGKCCWCVPPHKKAT